jgi:hypothetical protein
VVLDFLCRREELRKSKYTQKNDEEREMLITLPCVEISHRISLICKINTCQEKHKIIK